jgi:hypothetical protein
MSVQKLLEGRKFRFYRRTAAGPPAVFEFLCLFGSLDHEINIDSERFPLPNCDAPADLPAMFTSIAAIGDTVTGQGRMDAAKVKILETITRSGASGIYQLMIAEAAADGGGTLTGPFKITSFRRGTEGGKTVTVSVTFASDGPIEWADAA